MNAYNTEERINNLYIVNQLVSWAKETLRILISMAEERGMDKWFVKQLKEVREGLKTVGELERRSKDERDDGDSWQKDKA